MANLLLEVLIKAVDQASGVFKHVGGAMHSLNEQGKHLREAGENMAVFGAKMMAGGAAVGYALLGPVKAAAEAQGQMAHIATAINMTAEQSRQAQETFDKLAQHGVIGTEELRHGFYLAVANGADFADALTAVAAANNEVTATAENAEAANAVYASSIRSLTGLHNVYGVGVNELADKLAALQSKYAFNDIGEINDAMRVVAPVAKNAHVGINTLAASLAVLSKNMQVGAENGTEFRNILTEFEKGGTSGRLKQFQVFDKDGALDFEKSLAKFKAFLSTGTPVQQAAFMTKAGFGARTLSAMQTLLAQNADIAKIATDPDLVKAGFALNKADVRKAAADEQWAMLKNSLEVFEETLGATLLPTVNSLVLGLNNLVIKITDFTKAHPALTTMAMKFAAITSAALLIGGAIAVVGGGILGFVGTVLSPLGLVVGAVAGAGYLLYRNFDGVKKTFSGFTLKRVEGEFQHLSDLFRTKGFFGGIKAAYDEIPWSTIRLVVTNRTHEMVKSVEAQWNKIDWSGIWSSLSTETLAILKRIDNLFVTANWGEIGSEIGTAIGTGIVDLIKIDEKIWAYLKTVDWAAVGYGIIKFLADGIVAGSKLMVGAVGAIAKVIADHFIGHSPPPVGPLKYLDQNRIVQTLAETIVPEPVIAAVDHVASAVVAGVSKLVATVKETAAPLANTLVLPVQHAAGHAAAAVHHALNGIKSLVGTTPSDVLHGLMGTESNYGKMLTNPTSSAIGPYQMTRAFRETWGVTPAEAMDVSASTRIANHVIFDKYMPEFNGNLARALSAWHQGEGWVRKHGVDSAYVDSVLAHMSSASRPQTVHLELHYSPTIHGATPEDFNPKRHADEIMKIVDASIRDRMRTRLS